MFVTSIFLFFLVWFRFLLSQNLLIVFSFIVFVYITAFVNVSERQFRMSGGFVNSPFYTLIYFHSMREVI